MSYFIQKVSFRKNGSTMNNIDLQIISYFIFAVGLFFLFSFLSRNLLKKQFIQIHNMVKNYTPDNFKGTKNHIINNELKNMVDKTFAIIGIFLTLPIIPIIIVAIKLDSKGPALFIQRRIGLNGKVFKVFKFRTIYINEEINSKNYIDSNNDPRISKFGNFLRRTYLDQLPLLFNLLKGDISIL